VIHLLLCLVYFYTEVGMMLFGGRINTDPERSDEIGGPLSTAQLANSSFGQAGYYANNFNDMASGCVVCFEILLVNNWFVLSSGFEVVRGVGVARVFFVVLWVVGVLCVLNVLVATLLTAFNLAQSELLVEAEALEWRLLFCPCCRGVARNHCFARFFDLVRRAFVPKPSSKFAGDAQELALAALDEEELELQARVAELRDKRQALLALVQPEE